MLRERLAVCLSDRLVQSALALQFKLWRLGQPWWLQSDSGRAGAKADRTQNKMYVICNVPSTSQAVSEHRELVHHSINISLMILYKNRLKKAKYSIFIKQVTTAVSHWEWQCEELESGLPSVRCWWKNWIRCTSRTHNWRVRGEKKKKKEMTLKWGPFKVFIVENSKIVCVCFDMVKHRMQLQHHVESYDTCGLFLGLVEGTLYFNRLVCV